MKKILIVIPLLFLTLGILRAQEDLARQAENFYREGKYREAAADYNKILSEGLESFKLYYNLGNCYYKLGENTRAILNYERALLLKPGDADAQFNLKMALRQTVDKIDVLPELFFIRWYKAVVSHYGADQWAYISIVFFVLFLGMVAYFFYSTSVGLKKIGFSAGILCLLLTLLTVIFTVQQSRKLSERDYAIITTPSVTVKGAPDSSGTSLFVIHEGLKVKVIGTLGDWLNIQLVDGNEGWVLKSDLEKI